MCKSVLCFVSLFVWHTAMYMTTSGFSFKSGIKEKNRIPASVFGANTSDKHPTLFGEKRQLSNNERVKFMNVVNSFLNDDESFADLVRQYIDDEENDIFYRSIINSLAFHVNDIDLTSSVTKSDLLQQVKQNVANMIGQKCQQILLSNIVDKKSKTERFLNIEKDLAEKSSLYMQNRAIFDNIKE